MHVRPGKTTSASFDPIRWEGLHFCFLHVIRLSWHWARPFYASGAFIRPPQDIGRLLALTLLAAFALRPDLFA